MCTFPLLVPSGKPSREQAAKSRPVLRPAGLIAASCVEAFGMAFAYQRTMRSGTSHSLATVMVTEPSSVEETEP